MTRAQCIILRGDRILLARHRHGKNEWWCLPGGHVEPGETDAQAALRELREECRVTGTIIREAGTTTCDYDDDSHTFLVDIGSQEPEVGIDPEGKPERVLVGLAWLRLDELPEKDRAFLWSSGLLGISRFFHEVTSWGDDISYPKHRGSGGTAH